MPRNVLRRRADFQLLYKHGTSVRSTHVVLVYRHTDTGGRRCSVVASRKIGGAVLRNRGKRLLREAARFVRDRLVPVDVDIALIARAGIPKQSGSNIVREVEMLHIRSGLVLAGPADVPPGGGH